MAPPPDLQQTLERLSQTLEKSGRHGRKALVEVGRALREDLRASRKAAREERREARRQRSIENASVPGGLFALALAAALVGFALTHEHFWWLLFVALGIGTGGAKQLSHAAERKRLAAPPAPEKHEIDALCDQLLSDLQASPEAVRSFVQQPEKTVEALRSTAKAVDQRRRELAAEDAKGQLAALVQQRSDLRRRRDEAGDLEARNKFDAALRSLDGQEAALRQLATVGDRLDGEYTSLLVLLQEMKTRVAVARSTASTHSLQGLEQNVQRLNAELEAITESLHLTAIDEGATTGGVTPAERARVR